MTLSGLVPAPAAEVLQGLALAGYATAQAGLAVLSSHRYAILRGARGPVSARPEAPEHWPRVTVQLPVFEERGVVVRLIDAVAALDYPSDRLEIQVLDDSRDETRGLAAAAVARHRARGVDIRHLVREERTGFKAGALAAGLAQARGEFLAVFDADFVPPGDVLRRLLPWFGDPAVGMVQARWGHLNRTASLLTRAQAAMLDAHFLLEHAARMRRGWCFNFNGTAGVWRRAAIVSSGGWAHDTLTEDLDLSYRAQLRGWRFVFDADTVCPAELPADMRAFLSQQRRWTRGAIQTARKLLPAIWRSALPWRTRLEATLHLGSNAAYPLLLALGLLLVPVLLGESALPAAAIWALQGAVIALGVLPVGAFLFRGQRRAGHGRGESARAALAALVLGVGLSVNNARAVVAGFAPRVGLWERTPKRGDGRRAAYASGAGLAGRSELLLAGYFAAVLGWAAWTAQPRVLPFLALLVAGYAWVGRASWADRTPGAAR